MIAAVTRTRPAEEWIEAFLAGGVPAGPVLDLGQMWRHPQIEQLAMAQPIDHPSRGRAAVIGQPLTLGEHTEGILSELGLDAGDIDALRSAGVV